MAGEEEESEVIVKVLLARQYNLWGNGLWIRMIVLVRWCNAWDGSPSHKVASLQRF